MTQSFTPGDSAGFDEFLARYLAGGSQPRSIDLGRLLSADAQQMVQRAVAFSVGRGGRELDSLHVLRTLIETASVRQAIGRVGADPDAIMHAVDKRLPAPADPVGSAAATLTASAQRTLFHALQVARASGSSYIDPEHIFFALVLQTDTPAGQLLTEAGVTPEALTGQRERIPAAGRAGTALETSEHLARFGVDLTAKAQAGELDPVIGREDEIEQTIEILSRRTKNNPVLVGEAGVGKTAVVEGLAAAIVAETVPQQLRGTRVIALDLPAMLAGTRYRGDFEERLTKTMDEIAAHPGPLVVFIDEVHTVVGAGGGGDAMDAGNILKPRLARGDLRLIGATTLREYRTIEKDAALERRFQPVRVGEPSAEVAVQILQGLQGAYETHHRVHYTDAAIRAAVELSDRYLTSRVLPDKAIDLIDQAGARARLRSGVSLSQDEAAARVAELETQKRSAVAGEDFELASQLRDEISQVQQQGAAENIVQIDEADIAEVIARATGIPVSRLTESERDRLAALETELQARVVGQDDAVHAVSRAIRRSRTGMGDSARPIGSFLFLGPTGVGKTELAKTLGDALFPTQGKNIIRFDMSEFGEKHTVSRLVGAPPGYVGYDEAGQLTEQVRRNPYSVVLLDEIEKAHPDVFHLLLQVLDDGRLTDGQGRTVDFRNTVVIMTSNLGSEFLASRAGAIGFVADGGGATGFGDHNQLRVRVMAKLREAMRPEFVNRIDDIVLFHKLDASHVRRIVQQLLRHSAERLDAFGAVLEVSEAAVTWLAEHGYEPEYGARPLRRIIQRRVDDAIADILVHTELDAGSSVIVDVADGDLNVRLGSAQVRAA